VILSPSGAERIVIHAPGSNSAFTAADIRYELVEHAQLFHFGYPPLIAHMYSAEGTELADILKRVKELDVTTSFDLSQPDPSAPSSRTDWPTMLATVLPYVDVFVPGVEALLMMLRRPLFDKLVSRARRGNILDYVEPDVFSELGKTLLDMGAKVVAIKAGHRGLYLRTSNHHALEGMGHAQPAHPLSWANRELWAPCFSTTVVGTSGSGEATVPGDPHHA
jgi:sugar/nucleoside kinase (ribokinase family)